MAKVKLNPVLEGFRGALGDLVFKRYEDQTIVTRRIDTSDHPPTPGQLAQREQFRLAAIYGKAMLANPETRELYEEKADAKDIPVFSMLIGDFLNAPAVDEIDLAAYTGQPGETIRVRASDDFEVVGVGVTIRRTDGTVIEEGAAVKNGAIGAWDYTTTATVAVGETVSIEVTATDRPGHKGMKTAQKAA